MISQKEKSSDESLQEADKPYYFTAKWLYWGTVVIFIANLTPSHFLPPGQAYPEIGIQGLMILFDHV